MARLKESRLIPSLTDDPIRALDVMKTALAEANPLEVVNKIPEKDLAEALHNILLIVTSCKSLLIEMRTLDSDVLWKEVKINEDDPNTSDDDDVILLPVIVGVTKLDSGIYRRVIEKKPPKLEEPN